MMQAHLASVTVSSSVMLKTSPLRLGHRLDLRRIDALFLRVDHLDLFGPELFLDDGPESVLQRRLEDVEFIGVHRSLDDRLAQAVGGRDQDDVLEARFRVDGEDDARGPDVGAHHLLHTDGQEDRLIVETLVEAVGDGPVREERRKAALAGLDEGLLAPDVQEGLLLARKAGIRQVLGGGGTADGDVRIGSVLIAELPVGLDDLVPQVFGYRGVVDQVADFLSPRFEVVHIMGVEVLKDLLDIVPDPGRLDEVTVGLGRDGITVRDVYPFFLQVLPHFAQ